MNRPLGIVHWIVDPEAFADRDAARSQAASLLEAGLPSLQIRAKRWPAAEVARFAEPLRADASDAGASFLVNGNVEAAILLEADGVHLPAHAAARGISREGLPVGMKVGASCHDAEEIRRAAGADWVLLSPVFATRSKPDAPTLGPAGFAELAARSNAPVYALGGIDERNFSTCLDAGAVGCAAMSALSGRDGVRLVRAMLSWEAPRAR